MYRHATACIHRIRDAAPYKQQMMRQQIIRIAMRKHSRDGDQRMIQR
jgi:hypothetical protein